MPKMPELIEGFSQVEYLLIFNAIVFGAIASEYFSGWGAMLRNRDKIVFSPLQFAWSVYAFLLLIQNWFGIWPRAKYVNDHLGYFYFSLVPMILFYLISVILFPQMKLVKEVDFKEHYSKNVGILLLLFTIYLVFTIFGSLVYEDEGNVLQQNLVRGLGVLICLLAIKFKSKTWIQIVFLTLNFIGLILFMFLIPN